MRHKFYKSRRSGPRGQRHHIFKNDKPSNTSKNRKTTQVTKIVTVSGDGKETVKRFNHHDNQLINNQDFNQQNHQFANYDQNHNHLKKFNKHGQGNSDYDYQTNHHEHNQNWKQEINPPMHNPNWRQRHPNGHPDHHSHPPNPYPDFANPYPDGSYPTNPHFNPHPPNPPPHLIGEGPYPPWIAPKYKEYTTECCNTLNVSSSDTSSNIVRGN